VRVTREVGEPARAGRFAFVYQRRQDFAGGIRVVDPTSMIDLVCEQLVAGDDEEVAREEAFFAGAGLDDDELRAAGRDDRARKSAAKARHAQETRKNLGLGHDLRARDRAAGRPLGRRVRSGSRRRHPHQDARDRADGANAPRRAPGRRYAPRAAPWEFLRPMLSPRPRGHAPRRPRRR
jgi:hypothetical protein